MGISNTIPPSRLIQPGVVANTAARPTSPFEGQAIYQTDTDEVLYYNGTSWSRPLNIPWGVVGFAENQSLAQTGVTTVADITGLTVTFTGVSGRRYRVDGYLLLQSTVSADTVNLIIRNSAGTSLQQAIYPLPSNAHAYMCAASLITTASGSTTFKLSFQRQAGTGTMTANGGATFPAQIVVTDIGPA